MVDTPLIRSVAGISQRGHELKDVFEPGLRQARRKSLQQKRKFRVQTPV
jgi:hypothetical protein